MNEQELRAVVRAAIAKQLGGGEVPRPSSPVPGPQFEELQRPAMVPDSVPFGSHASHYIYMQLVNDNGGQCLIEPNVPCNHCGYCQSHGH
jgi:hypothetical protein